MGVSIVKNEQIANREIRINAIDETLLVADINVDAEGRVRIANADPEIYKLMAAAKRKPTPTPPTNTNCIECNAVAGCGPTNTVAGCGGKIREE